MSALTRSACVALLCLCPLFTFSTVSRGQNDQADLVLTNKTNVKVEVFWLVFDGNTEKSYGTLKPNESMTRVTGLGQTWIIREADTGKEVQRVTVAKASQQVDIVAAVKKPAAARSMPDLNNLFKVDAEMALQRAGISFKAVAGNATSDDTQLGRVHFQSTAAGTTVGANATVTFKYYRMARPAGVNEVKVPWVSNQSRWDAEMRLLRAGFLPRGVNPRETDVVQSYDTVYGDLQNPKGHQGDEPDQRSLAAFGSEVTYEYEYGKDQTAIGPYDAASPHPIPNIIVLANNDDSLDIAWTRRDGKSYYSRFSGENWSNVSHQEVTNALRLLGGMARDARGITYLATTRMEYVRGEDEKGLYRPQVVHLLKRGPNQAKFDLFLDLNQEQFSPAIFNPQNMEGALFHPSRLVFGKGQLAFAFGQNHGGAHTTSNLIAVGTDGTSKYNGGGSQHSTDVRLIFDGTDFVMAEGFEAGMGLSKLSPSSGKRSWSDQILVFENKWRNQGSFDSFLRIGGIIPADDGYLVVLSHGKGAGGNYGPQEWSLEEDAALYTVKAPKKFETLTRFQWIEPDYRVPPLPGNFNRRVLLQPPRDRAYMRPNVVKIEDGKYLVLAERWNWRDPAFEGTFAVAIDANGQTQGSVKSLGKVRLHASSDAFFLPARGQAAWVNGDTVNNQLRLYTVDRNLNLQSYTLNLP